MTVSELNAEFTGHDLAATRILKEGRWHRLEIYRPPVGVSAGLYHVGLVHDTVYGVDSGGRRTERAVTDAEIMAAFLRDAPAGLARRVVVAAEVPARGLGRAGRS